MGIAQILVREVVLPIILLDATDEFLFVTRTNDTRSEHVPIPPGNSKMARRAIPSIPVNRPSISLLIGHTRRKEPVAKPGVPFRTEILKGANMTPNQFLLIAANGSGHDNSDCWYIAIGIGNECS
jgi:hypothetical protein